MANNISSYSYLQTSGSRITGLASGIDTESMVEKLMQAQSIQMEKLVQQKQKYEWQRDAYREVNTKLSTFEKTFFDNFGLQSKYPTKTVNVSDSTKISVTASASANGSLSVESVTQLATAGRTKPVSISAKGLQSSTTLSDAGITDKGEFKFTVDGKEQSIEYKPTDTMADLLKKLQSAGLKDASIKSGALELGEGVVVTDSTFSGIMDKDNILLYKADNSTTLSQVFKAKGDTELKDGVLTLNVLQNDGSMKETKINYKATDTINDFTSKLNKAGITAVFANGQMTLTANATGEAAGGSVQFVSDNTLDEKGIESKIPQSNNGIMSAIGFNTSDPKGIVESGTNAKYTINGIEMESTSNQVSVSGYTITFKETFNVPKLDNNGSPTEEIEQKSSPITITSTTDTDAMMSKMKDFINLYNDLITSLNGKIGEAKYKDFQPLTDAQRSQMTEDQIKKWEEKAKSGAIRSDSIVRNTLSNLRSILYKSVDFGDGKGKALFEIGITTTNTFTDGGKLEINEDKLKEALTKDPESVMKLFTQSDTGIVAQMRKISQNTVKTIEERAGKASSVDNTYTIGKQLEGLTDKIDDWKDRLKTIENRYWKQFSAMEDAIARANSQASYFAQ